MEVIKINLPLISLIITLTMVSARNFSSSQVTIPTAAEQDHVPPAAGWWAIIDRRYRNSSAARVLGDEKYNDPGCGPKGHNGHCDDDLCCSRWGYCGSSKKYCGDGCQPKFGRCHPHGGGGGVQPPMHNHVPPPMESQKPPPKQNHKPPPKQSHKPPPKHKHVPPPKPSHVPPPVESPPPCSCQDSTTTSSSAHTAGDDNKYNNPSCGREGHHGTCRDGLCCSKYSFCGYTDKYCGDGCQHGYGKCGGGGGGSHHSPPPAPDDDSPPPSPCTCD